MKKNNEMPGRKNSKKNEQHNMSKEKMSKFSDAKKSEDIGTMKIGKAHSMQDDNASINLREKK